MSLIVNSYREVETGVYKVFANNNVNVVGKVVGIDLALEPAVKVEPHVNVNAIAEGGVVDPEFGDVGVAPRGVGVDQKCVDVHANSLPTLYTIQHLSLIRNPIDEPLVAAEGVRDERVLMLILPSTFNCSTSALSTVQPLSLPYVPDKPLVAAEEAFKANVGVLLLATTPTILKDLEGRLTLYDADVASSNINVALLLLMFPLLLLLLMLLLLLKEKLI
ncbi:hypothetical protein ACH5RR_031509 [Cinchona calisaya]|uniref:Uncharacterized protein n=1 Tax=Cinchona calisaya TaxID=153742 RepID=A0ABD2YFG4_9GENT